MEKSKYARYPKQIKMEKELENDALDEEYETDEEREEAEEARALEVEAEENEKVIILEDVPKAKARRKKQKWEA